jgi:hypothetical protein
VREEPTQNPAEPGALGWKVAHYSAAAALVLEVLDGAVFVATADPAIRAPAAVFQVGWTVIIGLIIYGVWLRAPWGWWGGALLAAGNVVLTPLSLTSKLEIAGHAVVNTPLSTTVGWLKALVYALMLFGLVAVWQQRRAK